MFRYNVAFTPNSYATREDVITALNASSCSSFASSLYSIRFEDAGGAEKTYSGVSIVSSGGSYSASYVSHVNGDHTYNVADDPFIEAAPAANLTGYSSASTVGEARNSSDRWTFTFDVDGIGTVTAVSTSGSYHANSDLTDDDENCWWGWNGATPSGSSEQIFLNRMNSSHQIETPVYGSPDGITQEMPIQAGTEANQRIDIRYKCLNVDMLGLTATNTLTYDAANGVLNLLQ